MPRAPPYLEGGMLLHVPQQLGLLGRRVVTHRALELLPCKGGECRQARNSCVGMQCQARSQVHEDAPCHLGGQNLSQPGARRGADARPHTRPTKVGTDGRPPQGETGSQPAPPGEVPWAGIPGRLLKQEYRCVELSRGQKHGGAGQHGVGPSGRERGTAGAAPGGQSVRSGVGPGQQGLSHALEHGHHPESRGAYRCHQPTGKTCVLERLPRVGA